MKIGQKYIVIKEHGELWTHSILSMTSIGHPRFDGDQTVKLVTYKDSEGMLRSAMGRLNSPGQWIGWCLYDHQSNNGILDDPAYGHYCPHCLVEDKVRKHFAGNKEAIKEVMEREIARYKNTALDKEKGIVRQSYINAANRLQYELDRILSRP